MATQSGEIRNLESIPVGSLGIIPLEGCRELGEKVNQYLVEWRTERENEHKDSLAFAGYQRLKAGQQDGLSVTTTPRWPMTELTNPSEG